MRLIVFVCILGSALSSVAAMGETFFSDSFDQLPGTPQKWVIAGQPKTGDSVVVGNSGDATPGYCAFTEGKNVGIRSNPFGDQKTLWISCDVRLDSTFTSTQGCIIAPVNQTGQFPCDLRFIAHGTKTYSAIIMSKDADGKPLQQPLISGLAFGKWQHWIVGIVIDEPNGDGHYSVLHDDQTIASDVFFRSATDTTTMNALQVSGDCPNFRIAQVKVTDQKPQIAHLPALAYLQPHEPARIPFDLHVKEDGSMALVIGQATFPIRSQFGKPGGGMQGFGGDKDAWHATVSHKPDGSTQIAASCAAYTLDRQVAVDGSHVSIVDHLENKTNDLLGLPFANEIDTAGAAAVRVAGVAKPPPYELGTPETPFVQVDHMGGSVGLIVRDDVYRNQGVCYVSESGAGLKDEHFALAPHQPCDLVWELYPTAAPDSTANHFDFMNAVRAAWGANQITIPGVFGFVYQQRPWITVHKTLAEMNVDEMKQWLDVTGLQTICMGLNAEKDCQGYDPTNPKQKTKMPWAPIEAFGSDFLAAKTSKAYWDAIAARLRQAKPDLIIEPYFHMGCNPELPELVNCRAILATGKPKIFKNYTGIQRPYYIGTPDNAFGHIMEQVVAKIMGDAPWNGFYWDEYSFGNRPTYLDIADWDGHSAELDAATHAVKRKLTSMALITQPLRTQINQQIAAHQWTLWTNWQPTTQEDVAFPAMHFLEYFRPDEASRGQLDCPLCCGGSESTSQAEVMHDIYRYLGSGLMYVHYGASAYVETSESILKYFYPITPVELGPGYIVGKERVITERSGTFGLGDAAPLETIVFNRDGERKDEAVTDELHEGHRFAQVKLDDGEIAIITHRAAGAGGSTK